MVFKEQVSEIQSMTADLKEVLAGDSLNGVETAAIRAAAAEFGFDPSRDPELTRRMLEANDSLTNRILCSHPLLGSELKLMVVERGLCGSQEAILRPEEALQRAALERGDPTLLNILAEHPSLDPTLQESLLTKCFVLEKREYYAATTTIYFDAINKLRQRPDYDQQLDEQLMAALLQTNQANSDYLILHGYGYYMAGLELMLQASSSPVLEKATWQKMSKVALKRIVRLSELRACEEKENVRKAIDRMQSLVIDVFLGLLNSPVFEDILREHPSSRLEEVIKPSFTGDADMIAFGDLRGTLRNLSQEHKQAFADLDPAKQKALPDSWKHSLFEKK